MKRLLLSTIIVFGAAGCALTSGRGDGVDAVHLIGLPITLNFDSKPGADGFAARVFATRGGSAKGSPISSGSLEILMFDGALAANDDITTKPPVQAWKFAAKQLAPNREQSSLGAGYRFALRWDQPPKRGHITVVARYVPNKGSPVYSAPSAISAATR